MYGMVPSRWSGPHCGHDVVQTGCARQKMPYRCRHRDCRKRRITGRDRLEKTPVAGVLDRATGYVGTYRHMSCAHLQRYVPEFADRRKVREMGAETQMEKVVGGMAGKCLRYDDLIAA